jgi:hypothetical protein
VSGSTHDRDSGPIESLSGARIGDWRNSSSILASFLLSCTVLALLLLALSAFAAEAGSTTTALPPIPALQSHQIADGPQQAALQRLTFDGQSSPWTWTPDGRGVLVKRPGERVAGQQLYELALVSLDDGSGRRLAENAIHPVIEGRQVAYLRYVERGRWEAVVAALADGQPTSVHSAQWNLPPAWIDGEPIYLRPTGRWAGTSGPDQPPSLSALPSSFTRGKLSHSGQLLAATDGHRLWVLEGGMLYMIAQADQVWGFAWSPVAARLAYVRSDGGPSPELWLWEAATGRSRMLARGELEHFGAPAWSPDGHVLAFERRPTGNGRNTAGDIWLVDAGETVGLGQHPRDGVLSRDTLRPLAETSADESTPRWSPDGRRLALAIEGDTWVVALDRPGLRAEMVAAAQNVMLDVLGIEKPARPVRVAPLGLTAPLTIWVLHDGTRNTCRDVPDGQIDAIAFEQYVKRVVPNEVPALWPMEVVKAQAVAARTYGWRKALDRPHPAYPYTVMDSTADQYMCDRTHSRSDGAVDETEGQYVGYKGKVIYAFYCAETGDPTNYLMLFSGVPYLRSVSDPVSFGLARRGHSWGMSQWGSYRWAVRHGWGYQQILGHYYTSAGVERSALISSPLAALTLPWPNHYVTSDRMALHANASGSASTTAGSSVLTVTFSARLTQTWTTVYTDTKAGDGWGYVWPVGSLSDTVTPSIGIQVAAYDSAGQAAKSGVTLVGLNRGTLAGALGLSPALTSTEVTTLVVPLVLTGTDPSPDRGPLQFSLGSGDWLWEDSTLSWTAGEQVQDSLAGDGSAWHVGAGTLGTLSGPGTESLLPGRPYRAHFSLRAPAGVLTTSAELARLAVLAGTGDSVELLGVRYVRGTDVQAVDAYQEFVVDFPGIPDGGTPWWQVDGFGVSDLWVDRISVSSYPVEAASTFTWTLPPREGPAAITARFVDGAGNASPMLSLAVTVTDRTPPEQWRQFRCNDLTCAIQVRDAIAGLDADSAAARLSGEEGQSWSDWLSATCSGESGSNDWETLAVAVTSTATAGPTRYVQFRVSDGATRPNVGYSPTYAPSWAYLPMVIQEIR